MTEDTVLEPLAEIPDAPNEERDRLLMRVLEALLMASDQPLSLEQLSRLLGNELGVGKRDLRVALERLGESLADRAVELREVASGYRIQVRQDCAEWVSKLWQEKPPRLSRALLETLALICYRQPITRGEVEEVRGVALSPNIIRTLLERNWIREVGVKEVPGRPSLFGTTQQFLDDLSLSSLDDLPNLPEIKDPQQLEAALERLGEQLHEVSHVADAAAETSDDEQVSAEEGSVPIEAEADVDIDVDADVAPAPVEAASEADATEDDLMPPSVEVEVAAVVVVEVEVEVEAAPDAASEAGDGDAVATDDAPEVDADDEGDADGDAASDADDSDRPVH